jgi:phage antirepressor YoqD-like protein
VIGLKPREFIKKLAEDDVIFKRGSTWLPMQRHIDNGRFEVKTGESNGHAFNQTQVTPDGVAWLAKRYGQ